MRKRLIQITIVALIITSLAGCMSFRRPSPTPTPTPDTPVVPQPDQQNVQVTVADRVVKLVDAMPEVKASYALVVTNVAMVGVDLRDQLSGDKENELKTRISADTKKQIPQLAEVWVTADPDLVTRIRELADRISRGEPIIGLFEEITEIAKKLQPQSS